MLKFYSSLYLSFLISISAVIGQYSLDAPITSTHDLQEYVKVAPIRTNRDFDIDSLVFHPLSELSTQIDYKGFWVEIEISNSTLVETRGYLHFGDFDRIFVYDGFSKEVIQRMGTLYKKEIVPVSPFHTILPINIHPGKKIKYYAMLSTNYQHGCDISQLELLLLSPENIFTKFIYNRTSTIGAYIHIGLLFILAIIIIGLFVSFIIKPQNTLLILALVCVILFLFFIRDIEQFDRNIIFWSNWNESTFLSEGILRAMLVLSLTLFTLVQFDFGKFKTIAYTSSFFAITISIICGIYRIIILDPLTITSSFTNNLYITEIFITASNSAFILLLLWKLRAPYGRQFVYSTLAFAFVCYLSIYLNTTALGRLDSLLSSEMYSTYATLMYLLYMILSIIRKNYDERLEYQKSQLYSEQLFQVNKSKSKLYANISHEFRTPLTIIKGAIELSEIDSKVKKSIENQSDNLLNLVDEMLDLAKSDSQNTSVEYKHGDIVKYLAYLHESFSSMAASKNITLQFKSIQSEIIMDYDEHKTKHIASNLLTNAIKYTPNNGEVRTTLNKNKNYLLWTVGDTGMGIHSDHHNRIFERYYRVDSEDSSKGVGIGLALTKELVESMNGTIRVKSEPDKGSEFLVKLPIHNSIIPLLTNNIEAHTPKPAINSPIQNQKINVTADDEIILIVEDNSEILNYICSCLPSNYKQIVAANGQLGLELASTYIPDLIISDVMMPVMDGYELLKELKSNPKTNHIPTILLTAKAAQEEKEQGLELGANAYVIKPFSKSELNIRISSLIEERKVLQSHYTDYKKEARQVVDPWLVDFEAMIFENLENNMSVADYSKLHFMSRSQLHRKVKALTGNSTSQYIRLIKLRKAMDLLKTSKESVSNIAIQLGYKTTAHFSNDFKKEYGASPNQVS